MKIVKIYVFNIKIVQMATAVRRIALQMLQNKIGGASGPRGECSSQQQHSIAWQIVLMAKKAGPPDDRCKSGSEEAARATRAGRCSPAQK